MNETDSILPPLLAHITHPSMVAGLSLADRQILATELRQTIIRTVTANGGHLTPSLGVVELTPALPSVFDPEEDELVWNVGHQSYAWKLPTGRSENFHTLHRLGGINGFPKIEESPFDHFGVGHSSTSVSAAPGTAMARDLAGKKDHVLAVIGDGSLTGGLAFGGLNQAGGMGRRLIVVLNDSEVSISRNVGTLSPFLSRNMGRGWACRICREVENWLEPIPDIGDKMAEYTHRMHRGLRTVLTPGILFKALRLSYISPVNGHNIEEVERHLRVAAFADDQPVLLHVLTHKGKEYLPAEAQPSKLHRLGRFGIIMGQTQPKPAGAPPIYTDIFSETPCRLAREGDRIITVTAIMSSGMGTGCFKSRSPTRFTDMGICEQHAVTFAAGLASQGYRPFVAIYSTFPQRAYDQIIYDVCIQKLPMTLYLNRARLVSEDGPTHHETFDLSFLHHILNVKVFAPHDEPELQVALITSLNLGQPLVIRYPRGSTPGRPLLNAEPLISLPPFPLGEGELLRGDTDVVVIVVGNMMVATQNTAERLFIGTGRSATVFDARWTKSLPEKQLLDLVVRFDRILFAEEDALTGSFSFVVLELLVNNGTLRGQHIKCTDPPDAFVKRGTQAQLRHRLGLDDEGVYSTLKALVEEK